MQVLKHSVIVGPDWSCYVWWCCVFVLFIVFTAIKTSYACKTKQKRNKNSNRGNNKNETTVINIYICDWWVWGSLLDTMQGDGSLSSFNAWLIEDLAPLTHMIALWRKFCTESNELLHSGLIIFFCNNGSKSLLGCYGYSAHVTSARLERQVKRNSHALIH